MVDKEASEHGENSGQVFRILCDKIIRGEVLPGEKLKEVELAESLGIGRTPLREAMSQLMAKGLVKREPNRSSRVVNLGKDDLIELYQIRESLEGMGARLAAESIHGEALDKLGEFLEKSAKVDEVSPPIKVSPLSRTDLDFHYQVIQASGNERLFNMLCVDLYYLLRIYRIRFAGPGRIHKAMVQHRRIFEAIEQGNGELAEMLMRAHIRDAAKNMSLLLDENPTFGSGKDS